MSYENYNQGSGRPGFTEQPNSFEGGGGISQGQAYGNAPSAPATNFNNAGGSNYGQGNTGSNYGGGDRSGYPNAGGNYGGGGGGRPNGGNAGAGGYGGGGGGNWKGKSNSWGGNKGGFQKQALSPEQLAALQLPKRSIILAGNYGAPDSLAGVVREIADIARRANFAIRASSMDGFDKIVMENVPDAEFHIPWKDFGGVTNAKSNFNSDSCKEFAKRYLPEWGGIKESHQAFFCKNVRLVLGKNLDAHAHVAIIWSDDGVEGPANRGQRSAHAGHIAALCHACGIPVINISNPNAVQRLRNIIEGHTSHV